MGNEYIHFEATNVDIVEKSNTRKSDDLARVWCFFFSEISDGKSLKGCK